MTQKKSHDPGWLVVINPNAGRRKGLVDWEEISGYLREYGLNFTPVFTERPKHATEIVIDYVEREKFRKIVVVGGDGTMNEVINGIFLQKAIPTKKIKIGMVTVGTGNDWGRMFDIPSNYEQAIQVLKSGTTFVQDAGMVEFHNKEIISQNPDQL